MKKICYQTWLLTALTLLSFTAVQGGTTAQTDLASIAVTPLTRQAGAKADWQTIYDYTGGVLPPGSRITTEGKWIDPPVRQDKSGVTFGFPNLPDSPENGQQVSIGFGFDRPLADYPTRATISYTSFFDQSMTIGAGDIWGPQTTWSPQGTWSPFLIRASTAPNPLFGLLTPVAFFGASGDPKHASESEYQAAIAASPLKPVGDNTLVYSLDGKGGSSINLNGRDATDFFLKQPKENNDEDDAVFPMQKPGAMLLNGLSICNEVTQFPHNKGDWFAVHTFKIEQMRPPLEASSEAAVDLTVPGSEPVLVTIEVVDAKNDSKGYVLREARVAPGKYRLYWDGIDQKSPTPEETAWAGAGSYTFRLTTSKTAMHYCGEIDNTAPKYSSIGYQMLTCSALTMMPPGTTLPWAHGNKWTVKNNADDTRKFDGADSVACLSQGATCSGEWLTSDGAVIDPTTVNEAMAVGRDEAITPPDPSDPTNPKKQFIFVSMAWQNGNAVTSISFPLSKEDYFASQGQGKLGKPQPKTLTSPDWNRDKPGFVPYQIKIGQMPAMLGPQHELFFETAQTVPSKVHDRGSGDAVAKIPTTKLPKEDLQAEWVFRNVRFYEEGSPDPGPTTFDPSKFSIRPQPLNKNPNPSPAPLTQISETTPPTPPKTPKPKPPQPIPPGAITVEDNGHAVHLTDAPTVNYPLNYTVTPKTIMAFDLDVIDKSKVGHGNGIGLSPDVVATKDDEASHYFEFMDGAVANDPRHGFTDPSLGAYPYPTYKPNTLYTDSIPQSSVRGTQTNNLKINFLFEPGFYGLKVSEDGKFLFACNNADNRLEIRDISTDGHAVAKIPIDYPMFVTLAPPGAAGAAQGTRYVYVDSPKAGLQRIVWNLSGNTFGKPETITPASEFAYPRGLVYSPVDGRIFVCDAFNFDRSKEANQIAVIDPNSGKVLSRFGRKGGFNPATGIHYESENSPCYYQPPPQNVDSATGGAINEGVFTCPLTIDADSKGAIWVNDYYTTEMRKYDFDPATNGFKLERRVMGTNLTSRSHFFWLPDAPPTQAWVVANFFVRYDADFDADGLLTNQRVTAATDQLTPSPERCYPHFCKVGDHVYATFAATANVYEQVGNRWRARFALGGDTHTDKGESENAEAVARANGLLAKPGEPPTDLDKAIAASGDPDWKTRPWSWSDLNGDGKMEYTKDNPEFKIAFGSTLSLGDRLPHATFRSSDGAYVCAVNDKKNSAPSLLVLPPQTVNGKPSYDWKNAKTIPCLPGPDIVDVLAQDGRFYVLRNVYRAVFAKDSYLECYDESGKLLWTREHNNKALQSLQSLGDGMITVMDRGWSDIGPVMIRTKDGDLVNQVISRDGGDCWASGALRADADTGYIGIVQAYKVTGLATVKSAVATVNLPKAGL